jgi:hypothetical protein
LEAENSLDAYVPDKQIEIPGCLACCQTRISINGDDQVVFWLNGNYITPKANYRNWKYEDVHTLWGKPGWNTLAIQTQDLWMSEQATSFKVEADDGQGNLVTKAASLSTVSYVSAAVDPAWLAANPNWNQPGYSAIGQLWSLTGQICNQNWGGYTFWASCAVPGTNWVTPHTPSGNCAAASQYHLYIISFWCGSQNGNT